MNKIKSNDTVVVISGDDKGKRGKVLNVYPKKQLVVVAGMNLVKVHQRRSRQSDGGIIEHEAPMHLSNVALVCPQCDKEHRIGVSVQDDGRRVRVCKHCGQAIE